ncbi:MAG: hydantoinase B/oxoprolinase family protein [Armatimonadetes bacterium]|nr:hydantoinase B/oxoprolinase family protein [Armatimonadota bacterium]MDE2207768.1 hydantoinase B/oxoprolinase family protein [Armatimonadota bacterium]
MDEVRGAAPDPVQIAVWRHLLASVAEEMGATLERTASSPNIRDRRDASCAIFGPDGELIAQAAHIPVHLGAMAVLLRSLRNEVAWPRGIAWMCNDPAHGGTHLPDITVAMPVYVGLGKSARLVGFTASRAHHADVGGSSPGSLAPATELCQEGIVIPPVALMRGGSLQADPLAILCANTRTPDERRGDIAAQIGACRIGCRRLAAIVQTHGWDTYQLRLAEARRYSAAAIRSALLALPDGCWEAEDQLDDDGQTAGPLSIRVRLTLKGGHADIDFTGTAKQCQGPMNAPLAVTTSACWYVVRCLVGDEIPTNSGCWEPITIRAPHGCLLNPAEGAAVAAGNTETSQRVVDVLLAALGKCAPERFPAASQGTMNNLTIGGWDPTRRRNFTYYETLGGGAGAANHRPGSSAIHSHMTNTLNTPAEALESYYPLRIEALGIRSRSGGAGEFPGGDGLLRRTRLLTPAVVSILAERRDSRPPGAHGGGGGVTGRNSIVEADGSRRELPAKWSGAVAEECAVEIETPGGGGWGHEVQPADS